MCVYTNEKRNPRCDYRSGVYKNGVHKMLYNNLLNSPTINYLNVASEAFGC